MQVRIFTPIWHHPRFIRARPLRYRHENGRVIAHTRSQDDVLTTRDAHQIINGLQARIFDHQQCSRTDDAAMCKRDLGDLYEAVKECHDYWQVMNGKRFGDVA